MLDETKKLIGMLFKPSTFVGGAYKLWDTTDNTLAMSEDRETGLVEFNFDYQRTSGDIKAWVSEEEGLRRLKMKAFW